MNVCIGTNQQSSSLTTVLLQMNNIINISYDSTFVKFSVPNDGFIILDGINSPANMWRIDLDDIKYFNVLTKFVWMYRFCCSKF